MFGVDAMMKSMGLDPAKITASVTQMGEVVALIQVQLNRIEVDIRKISERVERMETAWINTAAQQNEAKTGRDGS